MMQIIFRVDANETIGIGHVMRCLSLADALSDYGMSIIFAVSDDNIVGLVNKRGYNVRILNCRWENLAENINELINLIQQYKADLLITDSYYTSQEYFARVHQFCKTVTITEGIPKSEMKGIDLFINYNFFMNEFKTDHNNYKMCLGTDYALLRRDYISANNCEGNSILILTGGSDSLNIATNIVKKLVQHVDSAMIVVVTSGINPNLNQLKEICARNSVLLLEDVADMVNVMRKAKIAVSAGGLTLYELCACGVPTITYSFVDNQLKNTFAFSKSGIMPYAGDYRDNPSDVVEKIKTLSLELINDDSYRKFISKRMTTICDGKGAIRVARAILDLTRDN